MCEQASCFFDCSQSVCALLEMTNSFPKPPESPKLPSQSTGGVYAQPNAGRGVGERSILFVLYLGPASLLCTFPPSLPLPGARELQSPLGDTCLAPALRVGVWGTPSTLQVCKQQHSRVTVSAAVHCLLELLLSLHPGMLWWWWAGCEIVAIAQVGAVGWEGRLGS